MVLGRDSSWQVPSGLVDEVLHHAWGSSPRLHPELGMDMRQRGHGPIRAGLLAVVAQ